MLNSRESVEAVCRADAERLWHRARAYRRSYAGRLSYMLPDVVGSPILRRVPPVRRALRFVGVGRQVGLRPVRLRGEWLIDPEGDDPFVAMIEERYRISGSSLPKEERDRQGLPRRGP